MMINLKRLVISTLLAMIVMLGISYVWHGIILNDFKNLPFPFPFFMVLCTVVYFLISLVINVVLFKIEFKENLTTKRILTGGLVGFSIYLIIFTLGHSYIDRGMKHIFSDFLWQMFEQGVGALVVDFCLHIYKRIDAFESIEE